MASINRKKIIQMTNWGHYKIKIIGLHFTGQQEAYKMANNAVDITDRALELLRSEGYNTKHRLMYAARYSIILMLHKELMSHGIKTVGELRIHALTKMIAIPPQAEALFRVLEMMTYEDMRHLGITHIDIDHNPLESLGGALHVLEYSVEDEDHVWLKTTEDFNDDVLLREDGATIFIDSVFLNPDGTTGLMPKRY